MDEGRLSRIFEQKKETEPGSVDRLLTPEEIAESEKTELRQWLPGFQSDYLQRLFAYARVGMLEIYRREKNGQPVGIFIKKKDGTPLFYTILNPEEQLKDFSLSKEELGN